MTDYWKSYAKKFCEICKCWYADNKISIERHEMGDRHKAMVQQRLRESAKKAKDKEIADHDLRMTVLAMEQAAMASMSGKSAKGGVPNTAAEQSTIMAENKFLKESTVEDTDSKEELRDQRRKLKELKRKSKQSQLWVDDEPQEEEKANVPDETSTGSIQWVQAETPGGLRYYWHIFSGETRWDQPKSFYTSEEYANRYSEIAAEIAVQNQFVLANNDPQTGQSTSAQTNSSYPVNDEGMHAGVIAPQFAPEMTKELTKQPTGLKREHHQEQGYQHELSKEERRRIKRERKAAAEGEVQIPEGLVELTKQPKEREMESSVLIDQIFMQNKREEPELIASSIAADSTVQVNHPLGPWVPVKKEIPPPNGTSTTHHKEKRSKKYDDLPEQEFGPGTAMLAHAPAELLEIAEMDPEDLAFKNKEATAIDVKKKSSKVVGFRRPTTGNSTNKSFRNRSGAS